MNIYQGALVTYSAAITSVRDEGFPPEGRDFSHVANLAESYIRLAGRRRSQVTSIVGMRIETDMPSIRARLVVELGTQYWFPAERPSGYRIRMPVTVLDGIAEFLRERIRRKAYAFSRWPDKREGWRVVSVEPRPEFVRDQGAEPPAILWALADSAIGPDLLAALEREDQETVRALVHRATIMRAKTQSVT